MHKHLCAQFYYYIALAVLKKSYTKLCHCLPQDYMKTIYKIKQLLRPSDDVLNNLTALPTGDLINEKIIVTLVVSIKSDVDALNVCDIMENLVEDKSSTMHIETLRNGNVIYNT